MLLIFVFAISLTLPFLLYYYFSDQGEFYGVPEFLLNCVVSIFLATTISVLLIFICTVIPIGYTGKTLSATYESENVNISLHDKKIEFILDDDENITVKQKDLTIQTTSDNPSIQSKLEDGQNIVAIYTSSSDSTLMTQKTVTLYLSEHSYDVLHAITEGSDNDE